MRVDNAGIRRHGDAEVTSEADWRDIMAENPDAAFFLSRATLPVMRRQGGAAIVQRRLGPGAGGRPARRRLLRVEGRGGPTAPRPLKVPTAGRRGRPPRGGA